jgi:hypothetical protein
LTGSSLEFQEEKTLKEISLSEVEAKYNEDKNMTYADKVKKEVINMKTDFLGGCVYRYHKLADHKPEDGKNVGFVELIYFIINPKMVKKGLGTALMQELINTVQKYHDIKVK